jgi:hypothetical protein
MGATSTGALAVSAVMCPGVLRPGVALRADPVGADFPPTRPASGRIRARAAGAATLAIVDWRPSRPRCAVGRADSATVRTDGPAACARTLDPRPGSTPMGCTAVRCPAVRCPAVRCPAARCPAARCTAIARFVVGSAPPGRAPLADARLVVALIAAPSRPGRRTPRSDGGAVARRWSAERCSGSAGWFERRTGPAVPTSPAERAEAGSVVADLPSSLASDGVPADIVAMAGGRGVRPVAAGAIGWDANAPTMVTGTRVTRRPGAFGPAPATAARLRRSRQGLATPFVPPAGSRRMLPMS